MILRRKNDLELKICAKLYCVNSAAFIAPIRVYRKNRDRLCNSPIPIISKNRSGFDIDTIDDFNFLKKNLKIKQNQ